MPRTFPIKQGHAANLKPKGRRSKRYGASSRHPPHRRSVYGSAITCIRNAHQPKSGPIGNTQGPQPPLFATWTPTPSPTQERERVKTRSLPKTIGHPMIDKDSRMMR